MYLFEKKIFYILYLLIIFFTPLILIYLPVDYFDYGESLCVSKRLFNVSCYACGLTRSIQHFIHLDFKVAYELNNLIVIVFPILVFIYFREFSRLLKILK